VGFFSWECAVSNEDIMNQYSQRGATQCVLVCPDDSVIEEDFYEGYGVFGGRDAYALLAKWNDPNLEDDPVMEGQDDEDYRDQGINIAFGDAPIEYPLKFVAKDYYTGQKYNDLPASKDAEGQGFWSSNDEEDE